MGTELLLEFSLIIGIAALLAIICRTIKQPTIIAYLATGIIAGPLVFNIIKSAELIQLFADLGIAFLVFIVGLSLDFKVLKEVGRVAFFVGIGQVLVTGILGYFIAIALGLTPIAAFFIACALAFSSTIVLVKLLSDKSEIDTLHGRIAIGILLVQDIIASLILTLVPVVSSGIAVTLQHLIVGLVLVTAIFLFSRLIVPGALSVASKNQEVLFLFGAGWALLVTILFNMLGFPIEIGAFVAGLTLASSKFSLEIGSKIKGLRDFFIVIFFVFFGSKLLGPLDFELVRNAIVLSLFVLIGNPIIVMTIMRFLGYKKQLSFFTGISIAQISEFSLIIVLLGFNLGLLSQSILSVTILIALITIILSSYLMHYSGPIFRFLSPLLSVFDGKNEFGNSRHSKYEVILFGYNRIGFNLLKAFEEKKKKYLIVDYNPEVIKDLSKKRINCVYGDGNDPDLLKSINLKEAKIVISTIPNIETNLGILREIKSKAIFIPTSHSISETKQLYKAGADYVIMPHFLGGNYVADLIAKKDFNKEMLSKESKKLAKELAERESIGHEHPRRDHHGN